MAPRIGKMLFPLVFLVLPTFLLLTVVPLLADWAHGVPIPDGNTASDLLRSRLAELHEVLPDDAEEVRGPTLPAPP